MPYLLDTDIVVDYLGGDLPTKHLVDPLAASGIAVSTVTYMEVDQGVLESPDPAKAQAELEAFLANVAVIPFSQTIAHRCALLRRDLKQQGKRVRPRALDLMIAATALEHGLTLVTRNKSDYADVPGLVLY